MHAFAHPSVRLIRLDWIPSHNALHRLCMHLLTHPSVLPELDWIPRRNALLSLCMRWCSSFCPSYQLTTSLHCSPRTRYIGRGGMFNFARSSQFFQYMPAHLEHSSVLLCSCTHLLIHPSVLSDWTGYQQTSTTVSK